MHVILGANGIIGEELAKVLRRDYTSQIRLVGRNPEQVHAEDELCKGDLLNPADVDHALQGAEIAYLTVGLPYKSAVWLRDWVRIMEHVIAGCKKHTCKLVYFDNTYPYPQDAAVQTENTPLDPSGKKGQGKQRAAEKLLAAIHEQEIEAVICRAPEFYGPGKTKGITNTLVFEKLKAGESPKVLVTDQTLRTLIYTPDASRAMALIANTPTAYGQTWHLPCDDERLTYEGFIKTIADQLGRPIQHSVLKPFVLRVAALFNSNIKEMQELLPRYAIDNIFDSSKFKNNFPDFQVTTYQEGIQIILEDYEIK